MIAHGVSEKFVSTFGLHLLGCILSLGLIVFRAKKMLVIENYRKAYNFFPAAQCLGNGLILRTDMKCLTVSSVTFLRFSWKEATNFYKVSINKALTSPVSISPLPYF